LRTRRPPEASAATTMETCPSYNTRRGKRVASRGVCARRWAVHSPYTSMAWIAATRRTTVIDVRKHRHHHRRKTMAAIWYTGYIERSPRTTEPR
jgi:hypothetical protein